MFAPPGPLYRWAMDPRTLSTKLLIPTPCPVKWSEMEGNARVRHCARCRLNVYNVSEMTTADIERFLLAGKSACVQLRRRRDGTVVTGDCKQRWRERRSRASLRLIAGVSVLTATGLLMLMLVASVTIFADNLRRLFSMSCGGALAGDLSGTTPGTPAREGLRGFGGPTQPPT